MTGCMVSVKEVLRTVEKCTTTRKPLVLNNVYVVSILGYPVESFINVMVLNSEV